MAKLNMKDYTGSILIEAPHSANGLQSFVVDGTSELRPGFVCTNMTDYNIGKCDAADEQPCGVVLDSADLDIDAYFADNKVVTVALRGSGAVVWVYAKAASGAMRVGFVVVSDNATDNGFVIQGELGNEYVGTVVEYAPNDASDDYPIKIRLD